MRAFHIQQQQRLIKAKAALAKLLFCTIFRMLNELLILVADQYTKVSVMFLA